MRCIVLSFYDKNTTVAIQIFFLRAIVRIRIKKGNIHYNKEATVPLSSDIPIACLFDLKHVITWLRYIYIFIWICHSLDVCPIKYSIITFSFRNVEVFDIFITWVMEQNITLHVDDIYVTKEYTKYMISAFSFD